MKITKRQLRRIIREEKARLMSEGPDIPDGMGAMGGGKFQPRATSMGQTSKADELFNARDTLLGILETMDPDQAGSYIEDLVRELQMMQREM